MSFMYISTRGGHGAASASRVIVKGIADDGGLFVPTEIPALTAAELAALPDLGYRETAELVLGRFLDDFSPEDISGCVERAYGEAAFGGEPVRLEPLDGDTALLELWHGPTCAFKDMALQLMPELLASALRRNGTAGSALVLVATSGDTGKAALEGFRDVPGVSVAALFPAGGVSDIQRLQMITQRGDNVMAAAVRGNFDDAQTTVKNIFIDADFNKKLGGLGFFLTSANSINWGRLVPQIVYYIYASARLCGHGAPWEGRTIDVAVPTGNFGNILACFYAKRMGAPIGRMICAANSNNVLEDFINTGVYDRNRPFNKTISPSMDILISSNLERLLFELSGHDGAYVADLMERLAREGRYEASGAIKEQLSRLFLAGSCGDADTRAEIARVWAERRYLMDPHTAVASGVLERRRCETGERRPTLIVSAASPFKFAPDVLSALGAEAPLGGLEAAERLSELTGATVPQSLAELGGLPVRHGEVLGSAEVRGWLLEKLV